MNSMIEEIYYSICFDIKSSKEYLKEQDKYVTLMDKLSESLPDEFKDSINQLDRVTGGIEAERAKICFIEGFKMGMRTAIEVLKD
ncbi:MAG: hypothetical protein J1G05_06455 [Clostridiales bacterium]|nr:hypothetical protein [Clostridiales bacterium]